MLTTAQSEQLQRMLGKPFTPDRNLGLTMVMAGEALRLLQGNCLSWR